jgi:hypothetical protein
VSWQASPALPAPLFKQAKVLCVAGQHVWPPGHSQGFSLHGGGALEPELLEHAIASEAKKRIEPRLIMCAPAVP